MNRNAKLVVSIGPSVCDRECIKSAIDMGMDYGRHNMSHNTHEWHSEMIDSVRKAARERGKVVPIIMDVQGPSVRIRHFGTSEFIDIKKGQELTISTDDNSARGDIHVNYNGLPKMVDKGSLIYIQDASTQLIVKGKSGSSISCKAICDSSLGNKRTLHVPGKSFDLPVLREKDWNDIRFGISKDVDYFGISFVKSADDVEKVRRFLRDHDSRAKIISKIETPEAIEEIDSIIDASDGIMIARGDLGVIMPLEDVPTHQYNIIKKCKEKKKFVITATEMLESMKNKPRPTRAEVNDVFTAVASGSDAVMLSGETAEGKFPIESIDFMRRIIEAAEAGPHKIRVN